MATSEFITSLAAKVIHRARVLRLLKRRRYFSLLLGPSDRQEAGELMRQMKKDEHRSKKPKNVACLVDVVAGPRPLSGKAHRRIAQMSYYKEKHIVGESL